MSARPPQSALAREPGELPRRLLTVLVCAALEPGLPGVLLFDLPPEHLAAVTDVFAGLVRMAGGDSAGTPVQRSTLNAATVDEDLWLRPRIRRGPEGIEFTVEPGPLTETGTGASLVVVPDLARLSVPGTRAAVQLLGADVATVEHTGFRHRWRPRTRWLAVCRTEDVEQVSPHILDRFPLRLAVPGLRPEPEPDPLGPLPAAWAAALDPRAPRPPMPLHTEVPPRVLEMLDARDGAGHRRTLALARTARALARLEAAEAGPDATAGHSSAPRQGSVPPPGPHHVTAQHVDRAAELIRLRTVHRSAIPPGPGPAPTGPDLPEPRREDVEPVPGTTQDRHGALDTPVHSPGAEEPIGAATAPLPQDRIPDATPYPEDTAGPRAEGSELRHPAPRPAGAPRTGRGPVVGVRRARDLWDLAPVRTAMEAAKNRAVREGRDRLVITPQDLRGYVRAPEPVTLLTLVLDHTCHPGWDWHPALEPFLQWAYVTRASVQVVEVGSGAAADELRAESFAARSTRDPRIAAALDRPPGRATPLAHGLDRAGRALRHAFQHHRAGYVEALLVVVTDGRGNVPLAAAHRGRRPGHDPVGRAGIEDALAAAGRIGSLGRTRLHCVVVDPGRRPYTALPAELAHALRGSVIVGRPDDEAVDRA
ncbi:hypothetical protein OG508_12970 [Streptomyces sp. NBC_01108]|uniref:hypothetical protein n=1 Tax=Streptomyces sp. NBC_01108 TaxID=2903751 RepID=UPI003873B977|nr:hypothetical protein OG508_12970 [Streptomyces sp. NBC_01108]